MANVIDFQAKRGGRRRVYDVLPDDHPSIVNELRRCSICKVEWPLCDFGAFKYGKLGRSCRCKTCAGSDQARRSPRYKKARKAYQLKYRYGLSLEAMEALLQSQSGKCGICRDFITTDDRSAVVDHHHGTKAVRGILCVKCNIGLGVFRDSEEFLTAAIRYLKEKR